MDTPHTTWPTKTALAVRAALFNPETKVACTYGAPLGRFSGTPVNYQHEGAIYVRALTIDDQGYDKGGAYWGLGDTVYAVWDEVGGLDYFRSSKGPVSAVYEHSRGQKLGFSSIRYWFWQQLGRSGRLVGRYETLSTKPDEAPDNG